LVLIDNPLSNRSMLKPDEPKIIYLIWQVVLSYMVIAYIMFLLTYCYIYIIIIGTKIVFVLDTIIDTI